MLPGVAHRRQFKHLTEQEIIALAISSEEDDASIYRWYAQRLRADYPKSAQVFDGMAAEEDEHRASLVALHRRRFGDAIPLIRREHVAGFYHRRPVWLVENLGLERIREEAERMEVEARDFYQRARLDKQNMIPSFEWTGEALYDVATARLNACAKPGAQPTLADLFDAGVTQQRMIEAFRTLRVPRRLFKLLHAAIVAHCNAHTDQNPSWKIATTLFESTLALSLRDQDAFDRGVGAG